MDEGRTARPYLQLGACLAALRQHGPYLAVFVELPHAGGLRMVGNLLGDPMQMVTIGAADALMVARRAVCGSSSQIS